jgi:hypothetical protein
MSTKNTESYNDKYGEQRLELGKLVAEILSENNVKWCIENGTLLGAFRNESLIIQDDDFDIAVFFEENALDELNKLYNVIKDNLPEKYNVRAIDTYCNKLEVFEPSFGNYELNGIQYENASFHHVTVDVQLYALDDTNYVRQYPYNSFSIPKDLLFPFDKTIINGFKFSCPKETEEVLKLVYGYIGENARFNLETKKYELIDN